MTRLALSTTFMLLAAAAATPALAAGHYRAEPVNKPGVERLALRGTVWRCDEGGCTAQEANSRPEIICSALAKKLGALRSFTAGERIFTAEELENCNARAR